MKRVLQVFTIVLLLSLQSVHGKQNVDNQAYTTYEKGKKFYQAKQYDKALQWLLKSYELEKDANVANDIGLTYEKKRNYIEAIKWYKISIQGGSVKDSAYNLAILYEDIYKDYHNAIKYYKKAFEMGNTDGGG
jgi:TPR repeat protein